MWKSLINLIAFVVFFHTIIQATQPYTPKVVDPLSQSWRWKQFPELEGQGIRFIVEDKRGTIWLAYNEGIIEYDGYERVIHSEDRGLDKIPVEYILVTTDDNIYAVSSKGIYKKNQRIWELVFEVPDNVTIEFNKLAELSDGRIVATCNNGFIVLDKNIRFFTSENRIKSLKPRFTDVQWVALPNELFPDNDFVDISDILEDNENRIWFGVTMENEKGRILQVDFEELDKPFISNYSIVTSTDRFSLGESQKFLKARDGSIWIINSTYKTGVSIYKNKKWSYIKLSDFFSGDEYMTNINQTDDGTIWIGSLGKIYAYKDDLWNLYTAPNYPIPANQIILQKSKENHLWVTGYKSKVYYLDFSFEHWVSYENLNFQFQDNRGNHWFLNVDGNVVFQEENKWFQMSVKDGLMDAPILVYQTSSGQIWAAGSHQGIASTAVYDNGKWEKFLHPNLSWGIDYRSVFEDESGGLWFGGSVDPDVEKGQKGGLLMLANPQSKNKEWIHYAASENGLNQSNVYGIGQSPDGRIWIGGGNLYSFNGESWQRPIDIRLQQYVNVVTSTKDFLLAGSRYYGVFIFDGKKWYNYDKSSGLSGNTVISIDVASPQCIYVATENDISRFDGSRWNSNIFPDEMNMDFEGGSIKHDNKGAIWINKSSRSWKRRAFQYNKNLGSSTKNFVTHRYTPDNNPPNTHIILFSEEVSVEGNTLVEWTGTDYLNQSSSEDLMYSYKLGDGEWSPYTKEDHHTFMSLKNGNYTLQVKSRDGDLNEDPTPAMIEFEVLPPVWKQMWFILLMLTFLCLFGFYEFRIISKKQKLEALNHSLKDVNKKLQLKSEMVESKNREILAQQEHIISQAKDLEHTNHHLEERNFEIQMQKEKLEEMVAQIEELSKAKLGFFTNISHELRTPLSLISGPIEQLSRYGEEMSESSRKRLLTIIDKNSKRLLKLINQLLEIRKIEKRNLDIDYSYVDVNSFLHEIMSLFDNLAEQRQIHLDIINELETNKFLIDADKVEKMIVNLLSNSFKNVSYDDSILLHISKVDANQFQLSDNYDEYLAFSVEDTGRGIKEQDLTYIYDRYFSGNSISDDNSSGIGLAYIKELVILLKGDIRVESEPGVGTIFTIFLPVLDKESYPHSTMLSPQLKLTAKEAEDLMVSLSEYHEIQSAINEDSQTKPTILIVEDNVDMRIFLETMLIDKFRVLTAENGRIGLEMASGGSVDVIISDVMMPEMNGIELCKQIKNNIATSHIPIILLTAKILENDMKDGLEVGADDYITKPFNAELLQIRIDNLLQHKEKLKEFFNREFLLTPERIKLASPDEELLNKIVNIMEENLEDPNFNINQMCRMVHLSHMHFIRKVKQLTGKKPINLLKSFRLKRAKDLLAQNQLSIAEVSYKVGYDLPNSFSRAFKKEFGLSPKEFVSNEIAANN